jgi:IS30 family transposase
MGQYKQLTQEQRYQICAFLKVNFSQSSIAKEIGVHKSTVSRELKRNRGGRGYRPKQANDMAINRKKNAKKNVKLTPSLVSMIESLIIQDFSPEQISGSLNRNHSIHISHETIYRYIIADKRNDGHLYKHLRRATKKRKKRYGSKDSRGQLCGRISIDARPSIVDTKKRIGDWEIDTIIGKNHKGALLTIVERKSKLTLIQKLPNKQAKSVTDATIRLLKPYKKTVFTITSDNGKEFAHHETIGNKLKTKVYFAHPYHSWERGLNENTNGLIRQYFPKNKCFTKITDKQVHWVMNRLNNRPRKTLGFATPNEVFWEKNSSQITSLKN